MTTVIHNKLAKDDVVDRGPFEIKEGLVFCIELTKSLFEMDKTLRRSQFAEILSALNDTMAELLITLPNTGIGCYIYNVKGAENGILKLIELKDLNATDTKLISDILEDHRSGRQTFHTRFPVSSERNCTLLQVLSVIQDDFLYSRGEFKTKPYNNKKILLFTDNDSPYNGDYKLQLSLKKLLTDFQDSYIGITPFFIANKSNGDQFDKKEYDNILFQEEDDHDANKPQVTLTTSDKIRTKIKRVKEVKRVQYTCPLEIAPELRVSVKGFSLFTHEKLTGASSVKVVSEKDRFLIVNGANVMLDGVTGAEVTAEDNTKAFNVGNEDLIPLTEEQLAKIKNYGEPAKPILRIIGFRKIAQYLRHYNVMKCTFISPDNNGPYTHSRRTLSCLYQALMRTEKFAVVWGFNRTNSPPSLYALVPSGLCGSQFPEGFVLSRLPFKDDVRLLPPSVQLAPAPPQELVDGFQSVLKKFYMRNGYVPEDHENPGIQWHFKTIRDEFCQLELDADALDDKNEIRQSYLNEFDDTKKKINNVRSAIVSSAASKSGGSSLADLMKHLNSQVNKISLEDDQRVAGIDEADPEVDDETILKKRAKLSELTDLDVLRAYKEDKLNLFRVDQLKNYIRSRKISTLGNTKKDLIEAIQDFLSTKNIKQ